MGYLSAGFMAGASGEYLKQSGEDREAKKQAIRDKRLAETNKAQATHESNLIAGREQAERDWKSKNYEAPLTSTVVRDGKVVQEGKFRPHAPSSSTAPRDTMIQLVSGDFIEEDLLRKQWEGMAFEGRDEFGNPIGRRAEIPEYDEWRNARVMERHRINPQVREEPTSVEPSTSALDQARKEASERAGWLTSDETDFGPDGREAWIQKRAREIEAEKGAGKGGGMLTEDPPEAPAPASEPAEQPERSPVKLKSPLSRAAQTDPVQMYDELYAQLMSDPAVSEQDLIDTIRAYFNDPTWNPPPDALK